MKSKFGGFATSHRHVPSCAVVFYTEGGSKQQTSYATHHDVRQEGENFELGPGKSLTSKNIVDLAKLAAKGLKHEAEILPANVLVANDRLLAWWTPAGQQFMSFDIGWHDELPGKKRLQGVSGLVPVPALVFALQRNRAQGGSFLGLHILALAEDARPGANTQMFRAPVFNVNDAGDVCWGDGQRPKGRSVSDIAAWQSLFFSSVFTHYNGSVPMDCEDPYAFVADLIEAKASVFPKATLKPTKRSLANVVDNLAGADHG